MRPGGTRAFVSFLLIRRCPSEVLRTVREKRIGREIRVVHALSLSAVFAAILAISVPVVHLVVDVGFRLLGY
jgi:hypothetical protein